MLGEVVSDVRPVRLSLSVEGLAALSAVYSNLWEQKDGLLRELQIHLTMSTVGDSDDVASCLVRTTSPLHLNDQL